MHEKPTTCLCVYIYIYIVIVKSNIIVTLFILGLNAVYVCTLDSLYLYASWALNKSRSSSRTNSEDSSDMYSIQHYVIKFVSDLRQVGGFPRIWFNWFIMLNATFSNISAISWRPALVVEEAGVTGKNHRPWASNWYTLSLAGVNRVHPFCNLQNRARTHAVLVIGLYEMLGNPTT